MSSTSNMSSRVFKGCRVMLAAAKGGTPPRSSTATTTATKQRSTSSSSSSNPTTKGMVSSSSRKPARTLARPTGILKVTPVSPPLRKFLGVPEVSRTDAVKRIWDYIKLHNLQNPTNKKEICCDEKLKTIFDGKDKVGFLEIGKLLSAHFVKTD